MKKLQVSKAAAKVAKSAANATGKAVRTSSKMIKTSTKHAIHLGQAVMAINMPQSLTWIFSFGFKVGVFLILKSFLILRYQFFNLQLSGTIMVFTQFAQALVLIACGALMQNESLYDEPLKLRRIARYYGYALLGGLLVFVLREMFNWQFFKEPSAVNWFVDFFSSISKGASEIGLSLLFWDYDLWVAFCGLLYFITNTYLHVSFDYEDGIWAIIFDKVHFLRESYHTSEYIDEANPDNTEEELITDNED